MNNELNSPDQEEPEPEIDFSTETKPISSNAPISCIDKLFLFSNANNISIDLSALEDFQKKSHQQNLNKIIFVNACL